MLSSPPESGEVSDHGIPHGSSLPFCPVSTSASSRERYRSASQPADFSFSHPPPPPTDSPSAEVGNRARIFAVAQHHFLEPPSRIKFASPPPPNSSQSNYQERKSSSRRLVAVKTNRSPSLPVASSTSETPSIPVPRASVPTIPALVAPEPERPIPTFAPTTLLQSQTKFQRDVLGARNTTEVFVIHNHLLQSR